MNEKHALELSAGVKVAIALAALIFVVCVPFITLSAINTIFDVEIVMSFHKWFEIVVLWAIWGRSLKQ